MAVKPSIPKGTRDFSPTQVAQRNYIFNTIKTSFELFGFQPIETPSFENSSTLMGKYGEEGDRLIFKILNSGDFLRSFNENLIKAIKTALLNLREVILENPQNESIIDKFKSNFLNIYSNLLRSDKKIKFDESYVNLQKLTEDIWFRISEIILRKENFYNELLKNDNSSLSELSNIIFSDFYFQLGNKYVGNYISEKALRYDLTVPFARYVVQHQNEITFPFKRYQMQPVWRADRPQKGRFREFYQCDADVVGSTSLWQEISLVQLYDDAFTRLKLTNSIIKLNNRKILSGLAEIIGAKDKLIDFTVALDKLDKIGSEGVIAEMLSKGISQKAIDKVEPLFNFTGSNQDKLDKLRLMLSESVEGTKGVDDLQFVVDNIAKIGLQSAVLDLEVTLARGLNYYTGAIFEVEVPGVKMGSVGGGGRYDDLTGIFGLKGIGGIGISFGLDRIYLVLEELNLFETVNLPKPKVMFINFGESEALYAVNSIKKLRQNNLSAELYPDKAKMKKQMNYANKRQIDFVVLAGSTEIENKEYTLKNMQSGNQQNCSLKELIKILKNA